ncbi:hypothetical protein RvY_06354 [Ramazzottius varieornatus]|uniref:Uncharacterized protein n=1 Tax=Ramazzottius varieornatus TaxID=947166 RepID=A0A1D1UY87_RAMVA|nr:hypothetical protein RvY_06354 [Ramazzottius varieornatus]
MSHGSILLWSMRHKVRQEARRKARPDCRRRQLQSINITRKWPFLQGGLAFWLRLRRRRQRQFNSRHPGSGGANLQQQSPQEATELATLTFTAVLTG